MIKLILTCNKFFLAVVLSLSVYYPLTAQISSVSSGNWNSTFTWSGGTIPVAGDNVNIQNGHTVTVTADAACANITFTGANATLTVNSSFTLTASGTVTLNKQANANAACTLAGAGTLSCGNIAVGSATNAPTTNTTTRSHVITSTITSLTISGNLTINSYFAATNRIRNGSFYLASGSVLVGGAVTTVNANAANSSTFSMATGAQSGTLTLAGAAPFSISGTGTSTINLNGTSSLVIYNRAGAQTAYATAYNNLTLSGTNTKTFATTPTVNGILSMEGTAIVTVTAGVVTYGVNATLQYNTANPRTSSPEEWITPFAALGGVIITNTGAITLDLAKVFNASAPLTINSGAVLVTNNLQLTFGGNFVNGGTFTAGSSQIVIANTMVAQNIDGLTTTGLVSMTKTAGTATLTDNINGGGLTINGIGGTLNLGSGLTHTFTGAWTRTNGTLNGGSSLLKIGGSVIGAAGTFTAGTGTVEWYANGVQTCAAVIYNNLTLSGSGAKTVTGATVNGIMSMEGTATAAGAAPTYGAASTLQYKGSASQTTGIEFPATFSGTGGVIINNATGIILSGNVIVSNILTMTQGNVTTGAFILTLSNGVAGSLVYVSGTVIGKLRRAVNTTLSTDYIFPVGTAAFYRPAIMNFSSLSAGTNITAEFIATPPAGFIAYTDGIANLNNTFTEGYWRFISSGLPAATYTLNLTGNGFISYTINETTRITGRDNGNNTWRVLGAHGSQSGNDVSRSGVTNLNTTSFDFALATGCITTSMGYGYERNITIDYNKVTGGSNLFNFPVLINLTGQTFLKTSPTGQILNVNGFDLIFTDNNYNKLDHQLEYYSGTNGDLIAWVRIPILSSSSNTVIKILYGNPLITTDPSVTSVWDSHYKGIWHLNNNSLDDFTSFNKAGTSYNSPTYPAGRIYNSLSLNGTSQYAEVINDPNINFVGNITVSAWVYMNTGGRDQKIAGNQTTIGGGYKFGIYTNNMVEFEIRNAANTPSLNRAEPGGTVLGTAQWYYLTGISSDVLDSIKTFVNGMPERPFKKTGILGTASNTLSIGKEPFAADLYFDGRFDELRISDEVRSNGWMRTEYNNQSSPSTFYALDAIGVATNNLPPAGICTAPITLTFGYPSGGVYSGNPYIAGNVFTPPSAGTYPITYTYNVGCGSITKNIIITDSPTAPVASNKEYCSNQIAILEATSGVNIRWYYGGTPVSTANPFSTGQTAAGTYNYTVTQTVNGCESPATAVSLTIYSGITIITQPQPASICTSGNGTFSVAATGYNLTYQWQEAGGNIANGGIYSGATSATLTITNPGIAKNGLLYRCVISSSCGASTSNSNAVVLTVTTLPIATFSYSGTPYCPNAANPSPTFSGGGVAGTFSSTAGLIFVSTASGQVNLSASTPGSYTVTNTIAAAGGCGIVTATSPITIISDLIWTGTVSTNWNVPGNWSCGFIPGLTNSVQIPNVANKPVLNIGAIGTANNIVINIGSSLTIVGNTIQISGSITNNGTFTATAGTIEMKGSGAQLIGATVFAGNTIKDLIINNPAGVTLQGPLNITGIVTAQNGDLSSGGNLTLVSTTAQTALINGSGTGTVTGNVTMQRYLPSGFGYKYFSSPFQAATVNEFGDDMDLLASFPTFYEYDESRSSAGWVSYVSPAGVLNPLHGYAVNFGSNVAALTADVTGVVNNVNLSRTLYNNNNTYTKGFNLAGNPYPSPIDWDAASGWTKTNLDDALYYFKASAVDQYGGTYRSYINGISSDGTVSNIIPSMQGFFVHVSNGAFPVTGTLGLDNNVRITDLTHSFTKSKSNSSVQLLRLTAGFSDDPASADPMVIYFDEKAQKEFDSRLDALKLMNTDYLVPNLYAVASDGYNLSVDALPVTEDSLLYVQIGLRTSRDGSITFRIRDKDNLSTGTQVFLYDNKTGADQSLNLSGEYNIYLIAGEYNNRFSLRFIKGTADITENDPDTELFNIYSSSSSLIADITLLPGKRGTLIINNISGQIVFRKEIYEGGYHEFNPELKTGIYIVNFITGNTRAVKKIFILNK